MLRLRPTLSTELPNIVAMERDDSASRFVASWSVERHRRAIDEPGKAHLSIVGAAESNAALGFVILAGLYGPQQSVELRRIVVAEKGKGVCRAPLRLIKHHVFDELQAHRLWLDVKDFNARAIALYRSEGFVEEGRLRDALRSPDGFETVIVMSLLEQEHRKLRA